MNEPTPPADPGATKPRPLTPLRIAGWGCAALAAFAVLFAVVATVMIRQEASKPLNRDAEIIGLAGLPLYPDAQFDDEATREERAATVVAKGLYAADSATVVVLRTNDDPKTRIVPFYDAALQKLGLTKTTLGANNGEGASYANDTTTVVIQTRDDPGEARQLILRRFDTGPKRELTRRADIVTPDDFKNAPVVPKGSLKASPGSSMPSPSPAAVSGTTIRK